MLSTTLDNLLEQRPPGMASGGLFPLLPVLTADGVHPQGISLDPPQFPSMLSVLPAIQKRTENNESLHH